MRELFISSAPAPRDSWLQFETELPLTSSPTPWRDRRATIPSLVRYAWSCLELIIEIANNQEKITYEELADRSGTKPGAPRVAHRSRLSFVEDETTWMLAAACA